MDSLSLRPWFQATAKGRLPLPPTPTTRLVPAPVPSPLPPLNYNSTSRLSFSAVPTAHCLAGPLRCRADYKVLAGRDGWNLLFILFSLEPSTQQP